MLKELRTKSGHDLFIVSSALQKAIRRNEPRLAGWAIIELFQSGYYNYAWKRLLLISAEDCHGLITHEVDALMRAQLQVQAKAKKGEFSGVLFFVKAVLLLCQCPKSRDADHLAFLNSNDLLVTDVEVETYLKDVEPVSPKDIPVYVLDCHTKQGRQMGKTKAEFWKTEHDALSPRVPGLFDHIDILGGAPSHTENQADPAS